MTDSNQDLQNDADREWFLLLGQRYQGPFAFTEICEKIAHSTLSPATLTWTEGMSDWIALNQVETFKALTKNLPVANDPDMYDDSDMFSIGAIDTELAESFSSALNTNGASDVLSEERAAPAESELPALQTQKPTFVRNDVIWAELMKSQGVGDLAPRLHLKVDPVEVKSKRSVPAWKDAVLAVTVVAAVGAAAFSVARFRAEVISPLQDVSREENRELQAAAAEAVKPGSPAAAVAISKADPFLPFFYVATNLQEGAHIEIQIDGVPDTLIGKFKVSVRADASVKNHLVRTPPFRQDDGLPYPKGDYRVTVLCASCSSNSTSNGTSNGDVSAPAIVPVAAPVIAQKTYFLGGVKNADYDQRLKTYHETLVLQAQTEIGEIKQITDTVQSQLDETAGTFERVITLLQKHPRIRRPGKTWSDFHPTWIHLQDQLDSLMQRWTPDSLEVGYFHGALYSLLKQAGDHVRQLHQSQDDYLASTSVDEAAQAAARTKILSETALIRALLKSLRDKTIATELLPTSAGGMPQH
jgi:hypothetical protein